MEGMEGIPQKPRLESLGVWSVLQRGQGAISLQASCRIAKLRLSRIGVSYLCMQRFCIGQIKVVHVSYVESRTKSPILHCTPLFSHEILLSLWLFSRGDVDFASFAG